MYLVCPATTLLPSRSCCGSGTEAVFNDRRVINIHCVPMDSDVHENFARGIKAAEQHRRPSSTNTPSNLDGAEFAFASAVD